MSGMATSYDMAYLAEGEKLQKGPLVVCAGSLLLLGGFLLPWINFSEVAGSPSVAGFEMPGYLRAMTSLMSLVTGQGMSSAGLLSSLLWTIPAVGAVALITGFLAAASQRSGPGFGGLHLLLTGDVLALFAFLVVALSRLPGEGAGMLLELAGMGLWLTIGGTIFVLVGALMELRRR